MAKARLPGGVSSPVRAFLAVGGTPRFISRGAGCRVWDVDGNEYVDYLGSWGPLILGHAHPEVVQAIQSAAASGASFGAPSEPELELAALLQDAMPSLELVRFVSSGTEAAMSALRVARAFTGRDKIVKFQGGYHGHADGLLARAGSGALTLGVPDSPGVPESYAAHTLLAPYNDVGAAEQLFHAMPGQIAAVIVEPVAGNMGVVAPLPGFLEGLRRITEAAGALLIFDEVITGFRVAYGGAQGLFGIRPDLTCLGKIIGGGLPVGAYGGRREVMELVAPSGPVYQAGTLSGNPVAMAAGVATLRTLKADDPYPRLEAMAADFERGLKEVAREAGVALTISRVGSMLTPFFTAGRVEDLDSATGADTASYARFFHAMLDSGIYIPPSQFEAWFLSTAHGSPEVEQTVEAARRALPHSQL